MRLALAAVAVSVVIAAPAGSIAGPPLRGEVIGTSVQGRPIRLVHIGDPDAPRKVLVVGCIHGSERAGLEVTRALRHAIPPAGTELLVLDTANPDGCAAGTRGNADGVDLNRNFPWGWRPLTGLFYSGRHSSSEPETRAIEAMILRERPEVSIWFHQHLDWVDLQRGSSLALMERYAQATGMRAVRTPILPGTVARWENHRLRGTSAFVVELPAGALPTAGVAAQVRAILALSAAQPPSAPAAPAAPHASRSALRGLSATWESGRSKTIVARRSAS
jgi:murein peptide amidase A